MAGKSRKRKNSSQSEKDKRNPNKERRKGGSFGSDKTMDSVTPQPNKTRSIANTPQCAQLSAQNVSMANIVSDPAINGTYTQYIPQGINLGSPNQCNTMQMQMHPLMPHIMQTPTFVPFPSGGGAFMTSTPMANTGNNVTQPSTPSNSDIMQYLKTNFDQMNERLAKLECLDSKVDEVDRKMSKLWSDMDSRVVRAEDSNARRENVEQGI